LNTIHIFYFQRRIYHKIRSSVWDGWICAFWY